MYADFVNKGGQLLGLLRDFISNTTQLSHAFLLCRVADAIYNNRSSTTKKKDEQSDSPDPINNEWIVKSSRILKVKIFSFLLDYDHHSLGHVSTLNASQHSYMISLKQILKNYYRSGYSLHDIESDLPISRLLAKYILNQIETHIPEKKGNKSNEPNEEKGEGINPQQNEKEMRMQRAYAKNEMFIETLLFLFDVIDYIASNKTIDYDAIVQHVSSQQVQFNVNYLDTDFIDTVLKNIYFTIRIVPDHIKLDWLILYSLFDIYERIISRDEISDQLQLLHKFQTCCTKILQFYGTSNMNVMLEIVILNGQLWYYVLSGLLNEHILTHDADAKQSAEGIELQRDIITASVEWIKFISKIIDSLILLQESNKNNLINLQNQSEEKKNDSPNFAPSNLSTQISALKMQTLKLSQSTQNEIETFLTRRKSESNHGYQREKAYLYEDDSELNSWPPKSTAVSFVNKQYLQPGTLLFFTSRSVIYTSHLRSMLNLYLQILRLHFVSMRAKIFVIASHADASSKKKKKEIFLFDIFPDFKEFDCNLFTFELFQSYTSSTGGDNENKNNKIVKYDGIKSVKFGCVMMIAKKWIAGALDLSVSWNLDGNKVKRCIIIELCNNYKDDIGVQLMIDDLDYNSVNDDEDTNNKRLLANSLLFIVKKRLSFYLNQLLHSAQHQHVLSGIPADVFQELLHFNNRLSNNDIEKDKELHMKLMLSSKDKKEIKENAAKVLKMNLKLMLAINSLLQQDEFYEQNTKQQINTFIQIIKLLIKVN